MPIAEDGFGDDAMMPGDELAARVEARLDVMRRHRAEFTESKVLLPAPDHLDRLADRLGEADCVMHDILLRAAAPEATAENVLVERDVRTLRPEHPRNLAQYVGR